MAVKAKAEITLYKIISVDKVVRYYLLQSSTLAAPSKPADGAVIGSNWSKTEPSYTSGSTSTLYFVDQTVLSNGTLKYSEVSKSSSYEAAKEAWNKANNAQKTADSANSKIDGLQVGGRNLARKTSSDWSSWIIPVANKANICASLTSIYPGDKKVGDIFTITFDIEVKKFTAGSGGTFNIFFQGAVDGAWKVSNPFVNISPVFDFKTKALAGDFTERVSATCKIINDNQASAKKFDFDVRCDYSDGTGKYRIKNLKVEKGNKATDWTPAPEDAMADTYQEYYLSTSQTALSGGSWSTTAPTWANGKYMWSRTVKVDGAGNKTYTPSQNGVCIAGAKGDTGASGKGIKSTAITYQLSASQTKAPTGTWLSSPPKTDIATPYLWTRTVITYTDNTTSTSYGISSTWTPALEDLKTRISDAETAISNNAKEIKLKASRDEVTAISDNLKVLTKTSTEFKQTVEGWQLNWDKLISTDNAEVASHQDYITFDKGDIILGESSNDLKLKITNDSIQFKGTSNTEVTPDKDATAWITGKTFHISDGEIQNSLKFGKLYLKPNNENNSVDLYYSDSESDVISGSYVRLGQTISMGNGMGSGFLKLNTGCIQMYPTTLADTIGNDNTGKFELHAGGSYPYIIFGDYNTNDEAKKEKGRYSVRIGGSNTVSGNCSVAIGYSSDVSGKNSTAIGHYLKNISDNQLLIGKYNISSDYPFIIGNGSSDTERSNALTVDWDGNITGKSLTSANDLKLGFGSSNIFKPYFTKGDSITLTIYAVGYVTTGGKEVAMYVPLSRPIIAGGSVSVASVHGLTIRQNGKYLYSSSASNSVNPSSFRAAIVGSGCGVNIVATFGNTVNATVNDVCSITASIKITFS